MLISERFLLHMEAHGSAFHEMFLVDFRSNIGIQNWVARRTEDCISVLIHHRWRVLTNEILLLHHTALTDFLHLKGVVGSGDFVAVSDSRTQLLLQTVYCRLCC